MLSEYCLSVMFVILHTDSNIVILYHLSLLKINVVEH